jgi:spermidine synthase
VGDCVVCFGLILVPTVRMGATLPLLVEHLVRRSCSVGVSVGSLYFANTLGSGMACFFAAGVLLPRLGQAGSVYVAAAVNATVAVAVLLHASASPRGAREEQDDDSNMAYEPADGVDHPPDRAGLPMGLALAATAFCGFSAIAYEILWYRLLAFAEGDRAQIFALLLGSYLVGIAMGSRFVERWTGTRPNQKSVLRRLTGVFLLTAIASFAVAPAIVWVLALISPLAGGNRAWPAYAMGWLLICAGAMGFGALFPLLAHAAIAPGSRPAMRSVISMPRTLPALLGDSSSALWQ